VVDRGLAIDGAVDWLIDDDDWLAVDWATGD